jgi:hypothetical protein
MRQSKLVCCRLLVVVIGDGKKKRKGTGNSCGSKIPGLGAAYLFP